MSEFADRYADLYDTLYADKDYAAEAAYVARRLRNARPGATSLLEFGSGTGRHARLLAAEGFDVVGIERSAAMLARAGATAAATPVRFVEGDIRTRRIDRTFDCVIALFHVVCYLRTDADILAAFENARRHLSPGGVFLFDFWYGPAVLTQKPETRIKEVTSAALHVVRHAHTTLDVDDNTARVDYSVFYKRHDEPRYDREDETHTMRYLFLLELRSFLRASGFTMVNAEEWLTSRPLAPTTWNGTIVARAA